MERGLGRLAVLQQLTSGLAARMELDTIAGFVLGVGLPAIDANRGTLCMLTADGRSLEVVAHSGYDPDMMHSWRRFALDEPFPASDAVRSRTPIYLHSRQERAERYPMFADTGGDGATAMLPLIASDEALGAIVFGFDGERSFDGDDRAFLESLSTQCAIALDRARLYESALRRQAALMLLSEASTGLARAADDLEGALQRFVDLVCPAIADMVEVRLLDAPAETSLIATSGKPQPMDTNRLQGAMRAGTEFSWDDAEVGRGIIVPMVARGRPIGACVFVNDAQRTMNDEDRTVARSLAERAAVLLDNARLMRQRKEVSTGLQAALLPPSLPAIPGYELGARYEPAGEGLEVGGDFYDVIPLQDGEWLLVVGDVTGHGVEAAAATGLVRHTIRSAAMMGLRPAQVLDHANRAMLHSSGALPEGVYCTIAVALLSASGRIVVSCGGHPPPMIRRARGHVEQVEARGRMLGYFASVEAEEVPVELAPGDSLIAFTDGVVERHSGSNWFSEEDVMRIVAENDLDADGLAGIIRTHVVEAFDTAPGDDMAILVVRRTVE